MPHPDAHPRPTDLPGERTIGRTWPRLLPLPLAALVSIVVLAACGAASNGGTDPDPAADVSAEDGGPVEEPGDEPITDEELRIVTSFPVNSLDPIEGAHGNASFGAAETPLLQSPTGEPEPHLVTVERADELTWELVLRDGVRFHNGGELDATGLAAALEDQLEHRPAVQSQLAGATVEVAGDDRVRLTTATPDAAVPNHLADPGMFLVYDVDAVRAADDDPAGLLAAGHYTGPYIPDEHDDERLILTANTDHWAGTPPLARISVRIVPDAQARLFAVEGGEADVALYPPSDAADLLAGVDGLAFVTSEIVAEGFRLILDHREPPFDDVRVRQAAHLAMDEAALAQDVLGGPYVPATGLLPEGFPGALALQRHDPEEAEGLLTEAGWELQDDGMRERDGEPLSVRLMTYPQQPDLDPMSVTLQAQLAQVGFDVRIERSEDINTTMEDPSAWEAALYCCGQISGGGAVEPIWSRYFHTDGDVNWGAAGTAALDALLDELPAATGERRNEIIEQVQRTVIEEEASVVYAATRERFAVTTDRWSDFQLRPNLIFVTAETAPVAAG